jgi:hypothetical protein
MHDTSATFFSTNNLREARLKKKYSKKMSLYTTLKKTIRAFSGRRGHLEGARKVKDRKKHKKCCKKAAEAFA